METTQNFDYFPPFHPKDTPFSLPHHAATRATLPRKSYAKVIGLLS